MNSDLEQAAAILKRGGLVAFPTETVYGLGADAFNTLALARIFDVKGRPRFDPLIIHIAALSSLQRIVNLAALDSTAQKLLDTLINNFWPGPLTLVLPKQPEVPGLVSAGLSTVAVRFPAHPVAQNLIELSGGAIAAPSANRFGRLSPTRADHVKAELGDLIDYIVDGGPCSVGVESTVLSIDQGPRLLRPGGISLEQLEAIGVSVANYTTEDAAAEEGPAASPGMLKSHYAPDKPLSFYQPEEMITLGFCPEEGYLFFSGSSRNAWLERTGPAHTNHITALSEQGNLLEAAANLFEYLRRLDAQDIRRIHAEALPEEGIGRAVNDRLRRASALQ